MVNNNYPVEPKTYTVSYFDECKVCHCKKIEKQQELMTYKIN